MERKREKRRGSGWVREEQLKPTITDTRYRHAREGRLCRYARKEHVRVTFISRARRPRSSVYSCLQFPGTRVPCGVCPLLAEYLSGIPGSTVHTKEYENTDANARQIYA